MKKTILVIGLLCAALMVNAQKSYDYGLFLGMTENHIYSILPIPDTSGMDYAAGLYYRYSLNQRYSLRGGINTGFDRPTMNPMMLDAYALFEFNFHPLNPKRDKHRITSYIDVGLSYLIDFPQYNLVKSLPDASMGSYWARNIRIPFNVGVRYNVTQSLTLGIEWALRKGYQLDYMEPDNLNPGTKPEFSPLIANWRSHIGITIGYMVSNYCKTCPFYENERKKLK
jgi:hypothetical protein